MISELISNLITLFVVGALVYLGLAVAGTRWKICKSAASFYAALTFAILSVLFALWWSRPKREGIGNLVQDPVYEDDEEEFLWG